MILLLLKFKKGLHKFFSDATPVTMVDPNPCSWATVQTDDAMETKCCPYCGETILAIAKKCKHCGEWIKEEDEIKKTEEPEKDKSPVYIQCPICGEDVEKGIAICPYCNEPIKE